MEAAMLFYSLVLLVCAIQASASYVQDTWLHAQSDNEDRSLRGHFSMYLQVPTYVTRPVEESQGEGSARRPAVIVAHHAVGIYNHNFLRQFADDLANQGFVTVLPDFFHRVWNETVPNGLGIPVDKMNIMAALGSLRDSEIVDDLTAVLQTLEHDPAVDPARIGILGFCMGGRIAWLAAVEPELEGRIHAAVPYHGGNVFKGLGEGAVAPSERMQRHLHCQVLGHFGALDKNPSVADMAKLRELAGSKLTVNVYADADHGFSCKDSAKYMEAAAAKAWGETLRFLKDTLGQPEKRSERTDL